nr:hypothetical protein [Streptomyces yokosukanensis]
MMLDPAKVDIAALPYRLPGPALEGMMANLEAIEAVLSEQASKLGVEVRRGGTVSAIAQSDESVVARAGEDEPADASAIQRCAGRAGCGMQPVRRETTSDWVPCLSAPTAWSPGQAISPQIVRRSSRPRAIGSAVRRSKAATPDDRCPTGKHRDVHR